MMYAKSNSVTPVFLLSGFFLLLFSSFLMISCSPETPENAGKASANVTQPEFPGGTEALIGFMQSNLQYPETARANGTSGKVVVSFMIDENGKVKDAKVVTAVDPALDAEALRLIAAMPDWKPAAKDGKNISTTMSLPVNFALNF